VSMNKVIKVVALILFIALLGYGSYKLLKKEASQSETETIVAQEQEQNSTDTALPVKVQTVVRGNLPMRLKISATADVWEKTVIKSEVSGNIEHIHTQVGQWVRNQQPLIKVDDTEKRLDVERAQATKLQNHSKYLVKEGSITYDQPEISAEQQAELNELRKDHQQALKQYELGKISEVELDRIQNSFEKARINSGTLREEVLKATESLTDATVALKHAELDLKRTEIRSPFEGQISEIKVSKGERVSVGQELLRVVNLNTVYLKGYALESEIRHLKPGVRTRIKFEAYPDRYFEGELSSVTPEVNAETKTITVYVKVDNREHLIMPGMHAEVDIEYKVFENVIKIPHQAYTTRSDRTVVFAIKDLNGNKGVADWRYVEFGERNDEEIMVTGGLEEGDLIVIEGQMTLAHQSTVRIEK
jgi:RND family efflux transporter MFP subunit